MYDIRSTKTGENLYPLFIERLKAMPPDFEPFSRRLLDAFGLFPATGDGHAGEYVSFAWETSSLKGFDFEAAEKRKNDIPAQLHEALSVHDGFKPLVGQISGERAVPIIDAILNNKNQYEQALNIPNRGCISGLPDWAIVEVPGVASGAGVHGLRVPQLPAGITALLAQQIAVQDRAVDAAINGDRKAALQALLLDPVVWSYDSAVQILDDLLVAHAGHLPRFRG
jgi:alpha-galactosidase